MSNQDQIDHNMVVLARRRGGKKKANPRSQMLKMVMPMLSREQGDKLAEAIVERSPQRFRAVWDTIRKQIIDKLVEEKKAAHASADHVELNGESFAELGDHIVESWDVEASAFDFSRVLMGNGSTTKLVRAFIANGRCDLENGYTICLEKTEVRIKANEARNATVVISAVLYSEDGKSFGSFKETAEPAAASVEIVLKAMSAASRASLV